MGNATKPWLESSDVLSMFPTFVWKLQLEPDTYHSINEGLSRLLASLRASEPELGRGTGWQSERTLHERRELRALMSCVYDGVATVVRFLRIGHSGFEVTGSWANVLAPGACHKIHNHPNNFLSGAYYVRVPPGADTVNFHDPRGQASIIRPPVTELTAENTDQVVVRVKEGTMLLFPAYLEHSVTATTSEDERVSISFNVMFSSFTEKMSKPLW